MTFFFLFHPGCLFFFFNKNSNKPSPPCGSHFSLREGELVLLGAFQPSGSACGKFQFPPTARGSSSLGIVTKIWKRETIEIICRLHM